MKIITPGQPSVWKGRCKCGCTVEVDGGDPALLRCQTPRNPLNERECRAAEAKPWLYYVKCPNCPGEIEVADDAQTDRHAEYIRILRDHNKPNWLMKLFGCRP